MARARKGNKVQTKLGFLIYGQQGTWKSSLCLDFMKMKRPDGKPFRVLYIDAEDGSVDSYIDNLEEMGINTENLYIVYTQSLQEIYEYMDCITKHDPIFAIDESGERTGESVLDADGQPFMPDALVIDSTTMVHMACEQARINFSQKRANVRAKNNNLVGEAKLVAVEGANLEVLDYKKLSQDGNNLVLNLNATGIHYAITAREKDETRSEKVDKEIKMVATGKKVPAGFKDLAYNVKTVLHTVVDDETGEVSAIVENKDRTQVCHQNQVIEEPTLLLWQEAIDKTKDREKFVIANDMKKAVQKEQEIYERELIQTHDMEDVKTDTENTTIATQDIGIDDKVTNILATFKSSDKAKKTAIKAIFEESGVKTPAELKSLTDVKILDNIISKIESI